MDQPTDCADVLYVSVRQDADGTVTTVHLLAEAPDPDTFHTSAQFRTTVWSAPAPTGPTTRAPGTKVLDPAHSNEYRDDDRRTWDTWADRARAFRAHSPGWCALRQVEARLVRAGVVSAHTGTVAVQEPGITITHGGIEFYVFRSSTGWWRLACDDPEDGWSVLADALAPPHASTRQVATRVLIHLSPHRIARASLPLLVRLRISAARTARSLARRGHRRTRAARSR
ncbi:hypothetical protein V2W30_41400 (plasmid) [Streptomyces sp. Q6]|uniref:Uncharacterized protein n=1 Tax=Streptomyces citrinus TaxID=3118173 RepID=A0ACD5AQX8_9ACTN